MKTETVSITCDISDCGNPNAKPDKIQVIFESDQTEGRPVDPYLSMESFDLCSTCKAKILKGNYVFGYGAQGVNTFYFPKQKS